MTALRPEVIDDRTSAAVLDGAAFEPPADLAGYEGDLGAAFSAAFCDHRQAVHRLARRLCGPALADDVTQDVFVALWAHPEAFDVARGSLRSFLLMRCYGRSIDVLRSNYARSVRQARSYRLERPTDPDDLDAGLVHLDLGTQLEAAFDAIPAAQAAPIKLAFYGQYSYRKVAAILGLPEGTVKSQIRAGLGHLRNILDSDPTLRPTR